jgi:hypothetical protein
MLKYETKNEIMSFEYKDIKLKTKFTLASIKECKDLYMYKDLLADLHKNTFKVLVLECASIVDTDYLKQVKMSVDEICDTYFTKDELSQIDQIIKEIFEVV